MPPIKCTIVTPERTALCEFADFVALPLFDGELGVAPSHSPMIGRLGYGELRYRVGLSVWRYYIDGGFVQVAHDEVNVLTQHAEPGEELIEEEERRRLEEAQQLPTDTPQAQAVRERLIAQARARLRLARRYV